MHRKAAGKPPAHRHSSVRADASGWHDIIRATALGLRYYATAGILGRVTG
jgi:hypothetical protein